MGLRRWLPPAVWAVPAILLYDDRAAGILKLSRSDSKESPTEAAPSSAYPRCLAIFQVYLRARGTAEDSPEFQLPWDECC